MPFCKTIQSETEGKEMTVIEFDELMTYASKLKANMSEADLAGPKGAELEDIIGTLTQGLRELKGRNF